ncbi:MAG: 3-deoxy-manno-octulosonate cytidylyltransferase [Chitinophagaceae bacterium]|nr:3-deoxy-manno-octulosonate cytidylyltransferase [Chitinophagaceae bacterium]
MHKKILALIPARLESTRFPQKLLKKLEGKTIIRRTYEAVVSTNLFDEVIVVCDHELIKNEIESIGGNVFLSKAVHESGTDRIAEASSDLASDIIVNVQGDEPFINKESLETLISIFENEQVEVASLKVKIEDLTQVQNPNCVKVVTDKQGKALYFSRSPIPFVRDQFVSHTFYKHVGVYGFTRDALLKVSQLPASTLEQIEKLENLRMLENGIDIYLKEIAHVGISIDTEEEFAAAIQYLKENQS